MHNITSWRGEPGECGAIWKLEWLQVYNYCLKKAANNMVILKWYMFTSWLATYDLCSCPYKLWMAWWIFLEMEAWCQYCNCFGLLPLQTLNGLMDFSGRGSMVSVLQWFWYISSWKEIKDTKTFLQFCSIRSSKNMILVVHCRIITIIILLLIRCSSDQKC